MSVKDSATPIRFVITDRSQSLDVPRRNELLASMAAANRWGVVLLFIQGAAIIVVALAIDWARVLHEPLITSVAIAAIVGPYLLSVLRYVMQNKKELADLKEQTRFGSFDKHLLRSLFQDTLARLDLPQRHIPVYVVADKFSNAGALHVGLGFLSSSLNGIYLHRQALHKFTAQEVQDVMGHELGHFYRYYLLADRFLWVTLTLGALIGILVVQQFGFGSLISMFVLLGCTAALLKIASIPRAGLAWTIEYLCDDLGARVHSVEVSVAGLMKLGAEAEVLTAVQQQAALSVHKGNLNAQVIVESIAAAIPYGHVALDELRLAVDKQLKLRAAQGPSLSGFLRFMWQSDVDSAMNEEFETQTRLLQALQSVPRLDWEKLLDDPSELRFTERRLGELVDLIERSPESALFHTPEALGLLDSSHPPLKQRILYLWYNRAEINAHRNGHSGLSRAELT